MTNYDKWLQQQSRPVATQPAKPGMSIFPILMQIGLVAVIAWLLLGRQSTPQPGPGPEPTPIVDVADATEAASKQYAANLAKVYNLMADEVDAGKIKSRSDALEFAKRYALPARTNAFAPIDVLDNANMPEGEFGDPPGVAFYLREKAKGHERAAQ